MDIVFAVKGVQGFLNGSEVSELLRNLSVVEFSFYLGYPVLQIAERECCPPSSAGPWGVRVRALADLSLSNEIAQMQTVHRLKLERLRSQQGGPPQPSSPTGLALLFSLESPGPYQRPCQFWKR